MSADSSPVLCLDIGNTTSHLGVVRRGRAEISKSFRTRDLTLRPDSVLERLQQAAPGCSALSFSSVVPAARESLVEITKDLDLPLFNLSAATSPDLKFDYLQPEEIGQDRLANAVGVLELGPAPAVVIDLGTAVSFDVVAPPRTFIGGIIAPGLSLMTDYLHDRTALLPQLDTRSFSIQDRIGKSTYQAMEIGCTLGFEGMLRGLHEQALKHLTSLTKDPIRTVVTGGSVRWLKDTWIGSLDWEPDLSLIGLAAAWNYTRQTEGQSSQNGR